MKKDIDQIRIASRISLKFLCETMLGMKDWGDVHTDLSKFLKKSGRRKHIELPRGHLKSSIVTKGWTIQQALNNPDIRILLANAVWDNSRKFLRSIQKYLAPGNHLANYFGQFQSDHWNQDECTIRQRKKILDAPTWATTGIEKEQTSQHYDLIIGDDLVARENVSTAEQREKVLLYYKDLHDLLEPDGTIVIIGTRWHQDDLYSKILEDQGWDCFIRNCWKNGEDGTEPLFPQKFTKELLASLRRTKGAVEFSLQYMNNPIGTDAADFKRDWIHHYDPMTLHPSNLYLMVDPAKSLSKDANYSAGAMVGKFSNGKIRVVDYFRKRCVPSELVDTIFEMVKKWKENGYFVQCGIEAFTYLNLKEDIQRRQKEEKFYFQIDEVKKMRGPNGEKADVKEARIRGMQPLFEQGLVEWRDDMTAMEDELLAFPRGKTDDLIDALSLSIDKLLLSSEISPVKKVMPGTMAEMVKRMEGRLTGAAYEEFMADLRA